MSLEPSSSLPENVQPAASGSGPLLERDYWAIIEDSHCKPSGVMEMVQPRGWSRHYSRATIAREAAGPPLPDGPFARAWEQVGRYNFSDPRIVRAHFDPAAPLDGRVMLVEVLILGLRYLNPVLVSRVRSFSDEAHSMRGFRCDTLEGHFGRGLEWFLLSKDHQTGDVEFTVHAGWRGGQLPNWWSRIGFHLLARRYQRAWHRLAHTRLRALVGSVGLPRLPRGSRLVHSGPPLPVFTVQQARPASRRRRLRSNTNKRPPLLTRRGATTITRRRRPQRNWHERP